jgi:hypothetical protein
VAVVVAVVVGLVEVVLLPYLAWSVAWEVLLAEVFGELVLAVELVLVAEFQQQACCQQF